MKIMAFVGSPRKGSNVDPLIDKAIEGAGSSGACGSLEKIYLYDADIKTCTGCLACTALKGSQPCPLKDDMAGILSRMDAGRRLYFRHAQSCAFHVGGAGEPFLPHAAAD